MALLYVITKADFEKMREIIFLRANYFLAHFRGYFEGAKTCLTLKLSRAQGGTLEDAKARDFVPWFWDNDTRVGFFTYFA
jgi:hypothetical protein